MAESAHHFQPESEKKTQAVIEAVEKYDLVESPAWDDLSALSTHTYIDGIEVDPNGIIFEADDRFRGVMNVYVLLEYGDSKNDGFETSDSFLGRFQGHFDNTGNPVIEQVLVDTSPFYEGETERA